MSPWLIISPALMWLLALTLGRWARHAPPQKILRIMQAPGRPAPLPYDQYNMRHAMLVRIIRLQGWALLAIACFITLMSILVAVGVVPAARP